MANPAPATSFPQFPKLAPELRCKIWRKVVNAYPRTILLHRKPFNFSQPIVNTETRCLPPGVPIFLQVNHEARSEGLKHYIPIHEIIPVGGQVQTGPRVVYMNFATDTFAYLMLETQPQFQNTYFGTCPIPGTLLLDTQTLKSNIQWLVIDSRGCPAVWPGTIGIRNPPNNPYYTTFKGQTDENYAKSLAGDKIKGVVFSGETNFGDLELDGLDLPRKLMMHVRQGFRDSGENGKWVMEWWDVTMGVLRGVVSVDYNFTKGWPPV